MNAAQVEIKIPTQRISKLIQIDLTHCDILITSICLQSLDSSFCLILSLETISDLLCVSLRTTCNTLKKLKDMNLVSKNFKRFDFTGLVNFLNNIENPIDKQPLVR